MQLLLVEDQSANHGTPWSAEAKQLAQNHGWSINHADSYRAALEQAHQQQFDIILLARPERAQEAAMTEFRRLWMVVSTGKATTLLIASPDDDCAFAEDAPTVVDVIPASSAVHELNGRFAMIARYHKHVSNLLGEVDRMDRLGKRLSDHFREVDQEMQLASRLQRDFLPNVDQPIENLKFGSVYRPATWVSGDIYDVFRIDEVHTGFYVADAVGHGVAASLLTMFIKRSFVSKELCEGGYRVVEPGETLALLNQNLAEQQLPNCQFVTASYCVFNHQTNELSFARGGHPFPLLMRKSGQVEELKSNGGLLGLFPDETFELGRVQLEPGDKVLLYTDGVELAFQSRREGLPDTSAYLERFHEVASMPLQEMLSLLQHDLDEERGSLNPHDDITLVGVELRPDKV
ncbi:MAG: PP2C family protein-serine/threonine phosphatase [Phycisphaerae bacterium]